MTEEDARKKWCPHARVWQISGDITTAVAYNRTESELGSYTNPTRSRCIASDCMMWESWNNLGGGDCGLKRKSE